MNEREMLIKHIAAEAAKQIMENPIFRLLVAMDASKDNEELLMTNEEAAAMLPEHLEQIAESGFNVSLNAVCDVIEEMNTEFSRDNLMDAMNQNMDALIKDMKDQIQ